MHKNIAAAILFPIILYGCGSEKDVKNTVDDAVETTVDDVVETTVDDVVETTVDDVVETTVDDVVETTVDDVVETTVDDVVETTVDNVVETTVDDVVETTVDNVVETTVDDVVETTVDNVVETTVDNIVENTVDDVVETTVDDVVETTVSGVVETTVDDVVETTVSGVVETSVGEVVDGITISNSGSESVDFLFDSPVPLGVKINEWFSSISTNHGEFKYKISDATLQSNQVTSFGLADIYTGIVSNDNISIETQVIQLNADRTKVLMKHYYTFKTDAKVSDFNWFSADLLNKTDAKMFYGPAADTYYMSDYFALPVIDGYSKSGDMLKGGTPLNYVWNAAGGVAVAALSESAGTYKVPLSVDNKTTIFAVNYQPEINLKQKVNFLAGDVFESEWVMITYHQGDYFQPIRRLSLAQEQISNRDIVDAFSPEVAKAPYWKTWGLDPNLDGNFTQSQIEDDIVPLLKEVNIEWILLDWGWFDAEQNWHYNSDIFDSDEDIKRFISRLNANGMHVGLWYQPIQVDLGNDDVLANKSLMASLILDANGNAYIDDDDLGLLDPSKVETIKIIEENLALFKSWGVEMIYLDSQEAQLSSPPNYANDDPLSSHHALPEIYRLIQDYGDANGMVVEICLDGRSQSLLNFPIHVTNTGDPSNDRQARAELKSLKAISGDSSIVSMYVDHFDDNPVSGSFMNVIGLGAKLETMFNLESYADRKGEWKEWMDFYYNEDLVSGQYLDLYDIGFDYPEGHVVKQDDRFYYTFFTHYDGMYACLDTTCNDETLLEVEEEKSDVYKGNIELRGLNKNTPYKITTYPDNVVVEKSSDSEGNITLSGVTVTKELMYIVTKKSS